MKSIATRLKGVAWYHWLLASFIFIYLIYIALSYLYLPGKLKNVTEADVSKMIGREISVEKIQFNPFILSLTVNKFSIADKPEKPLVAWDQLMVDFGFWKSIFSWEIALDELNLDKPRFNIVKQKKGFNFSDIIERVSTSDSGQGSMSRKSDEGSSIAIEIFNTSINKGALRYTDISGNVPASSNLDDLSIVVDELYIATGDEHLNPFNINASGPHGGQLKLAGNYRIDPLHIEGSINIAGVDLSTFSGFLENILPIKLSEGKLSFSTNVLVEKDDQIQLKTENGTISINGLVLDDNVPDPSMLSAGDITVNGFSLALHHKKITVEKVLLDNITANQWIDKDSRPRYEGLLSYIKALATETKDESPVDKNEPEEPWDIQVNQVLLKNSTINLDDQNEGISRMHSLSSLHLDLKDVSLSPDSKILISLSAMLDENGDIRADGFISPFPFSMELNYQLGRLLLQPFSEYLEAASWLSIEEGSLSVDGNISIGKDEADATRVTGTLGLEDFKLNDTRTDNPFLSFKAFKVDDFKVEVDKQFVSIASVSLLKPEVHLYVSEQKEVNLSGLMKSKGKEAAMQPSAEEPEDSSKWTFEIEKTNLSDGIVLFSDKSLKPAYKTVLHNVSFSIDRVASDMKGAAPFSFNSNIDKYSPLTITGNLDPLDKQLAFSFQSKLKGLEMSHLSPYSGVYIGNNLKSGKLELNLDYTLYDRKIKGKNNIIAKNLYLGETVPGKPVVSAPMGLGLALLRDINGVIDLDVGISGDLDDPGFSISGIVIKALVNIIVKAAASPFKLLGALIPGGSDDLGEIIFDPGMSLLNQESKESLEKLVAALKKRPQLILSIKGNSARSEDIDALKLAHLKQQIAEKRGINISAVANELQGQEIWMPNENRHALEQINDEMKLPTVVKRMAKLKPATSENTVSSENLETQNAELEQKIYERIFKDILKAQEINEDELIALADQRALSIKQHLVDDLKLIHERVSVIKTRVSDLSGRVIKFELDVM